MADLKATLCGEMPQNEFSPQTEQLIALLERRGIVEDPSIVNEKPVRRNRLCAAICTITLR